MFREASLSEKCARKLANLSVFMTYTVRVSSGSLTGEAWASLKRLKFSFFICRLERCQELTPGLLSALAAQISLRNWGTVSALWSTSMSARYHHGWPLRILTGVTLAEGQTAWLTKSDTLPSLGQNESLQQHRSTWTWSTFVGRSIFARVN